MSKPVTSTVALMLFEEGRFRLEDPITKFAPEFERMRVLRSAEGPLEDSSAAERHITFKDLLTHCAGFTYAICIAGRSERRMPRRLGGAWTMSSLPDEWMERLAQLPLIDQPGAGFHYGHSTDLLGFLVARMEDAPLGDVLRAPNFQTAGNEGYGILSPCRKADPSRGAMRIQR